MRNRIDRVNLSFEGVDLKLSYRPLDWLRLYGGGAYLFDLDPPGIEPWATQAGIELQTPWRFWGDSTRRDTPVITGDSAMARGHLLQVLALGCGSASVLLGLYCGRLHRC